MSWSNMYCRSLKSVVISSRFSSLYDGVSRTLTERRRHILLVLYNGPVDCIGADSEECGTPNKNVFFQRHIGHSLYHAYRCHQSGLVGWVARSYHHPFAMRSQRHRVTGCSVLTAGSPLSVSCQSSQVISQPDLDRNTPAHFSVGTSCWTLLFRRRSKQNTGTHPHHAFPAHLWQVCQSLLFRRRYVSTHICQSVT